MWKNKPVKNIIDQAIKEFDDFGKQIDYDFISMAPNSRRSKFKWGLFIFSSGSGGILGFFLNESKIAPDYAFVFILLLIVALYGFSKMVSEMFEVANAGAYESARLALEIKEIRNELNEIKEKTPDRLDDKLRRLHELLMQVNRPAR